MKGKIISMQSRKGGTGKTVTTYNLAAALVRNGCKVLCIDLDPQCNLSTTLGYYPNDMDDTICDALTRVCSGRGYDPHRLIHSSEAGIDFIASSKILSTLNAMIEASANKNRVLSALFDTLRDEYDYIIIDNKAAMDIMTANSLYMSDYAIIVVESGIFSLDGLADISCEIEEARACTNGDLRILGILHNKSTNAKISKMISEAAEDAFGDLIFNTKIPYRHAMIEQAIEQQKPCVDIKRNTLAACYMALAEEVTNKTRSA